MMGKLLSLLGLELILLFHILCSSTTTSIWSEATGLGKQPKHSSLVIPQNSNHEPTFSLSLCTLISYKLKLWVNQSKKSGWSGRFPNKSNFFLEKEDKGKNHSSSNLKLTENVKNETEPISPMWGGNCTETNWKRCSSLKVYFGAYVAQNDPKKEFRNYTINCSEQKVLCLRNGWTVTRCQILCMGKCNRGSCTIIACYYYFPHFIMLNIKLCVCVKN